MLSDLSFPEFKLLIDILSKMKQPCSLLDVGCGEGSISAHFASLGFDVLAIDSTFLPTATHGESTIGETPLPLVHGREYLISPSHFSRASGLIDSSAPGRLRIREVDFFELEDDLRFNVVTLFAFLHYMETPEHVVEGLQKALCHLAPGGTLALSFISDDIPLGRGLTAILPNKIHVRKYLIKNGGSEIVWKEKIVEHSHGNSFDDPSEDAVFHQHNIIYSLWTFE